VKSVVASDSEEEYFYSEIEEVEASEEEMMDEATEEPIEEHEQSMMALDDEYDEAAPEPSPSKPANSIVLATMTHATVVASPESVVSKVKSSLVTPVTVRSADLDSPRSGRTEVSALTRHSSPLVADTTLAKKLDFDASMVQEDDYEPIEHDVDAQLYSDADESDKENEINQPRTKTKRTRTAHKKKTKEVSDKYVVEELHSPSIKTPGARRSRRRRIQPLAYWKNERVVYGRRESCKYSPQDISFSTFAVINTVVYRCFPDLCGLRAPTCRGRSKRFSVLS
jgi:centromere protein C